MQNDQSLIPNPGAQPNPAASMAPPIQPSQPSQPTSPAQSASPTQQPLQSDPSAPMRQASTVVTPSAQPGFAPAAPGTTSRPSSQPLASPLSIDDVVPKKHGLAETIALVFACLIAITFAGLFIWKYMEWDSVKTDVDAQIDAAVAIAVSENTTKLENEFTEREKYPYKTFSGPADYGSLSFEYPKTWNVYIARDAASGGDFEAYLNPGEVQPVGANTINALRVSIVNQSFDSVARNYESGIRNGTLSITTRNIGSAVANVYTGEIARDVRGVVAIFKLRDKTIILRTDAELFAEEFYKLLDTVTFVE